MSVFAWNFIRAIGYFLAQIKDTLPFVSFVPFLATRTACSKLNKFTNYRFRYLNGNRISFVTRSNARAMSVGKCHRIARRAPLSRSPRISFFSRININRYCHLVSLRLLLRIARGRLSPSASVHLESATFRRRWSNLTIV